MTDITITSYEPRDSKADLEITVDGEEYSATWDDDDGLQMMGVPELSDEVHTEVTARVELFFTFYDQAALDFKKADLAREAQAAVDDHLLRNATGAFTLHRAVKITAEHWGGAHGIITGVPGAGVYEVTYWGASDLPSKHDFSYTDLEAL